MGYKRPVITVNGKQELVARIVMSKKVGRPLTRQELVHHKDENPFNNDPDNLVIVSRAEHKRLHAAIGLTTRLKKKFHFDSKAIFELYQTQTAKEIASQYGCHARTINRVIKSCLSVNCDLRTLRSHAIRLGITRKYAHNKEGLCFKHGKEMCS